MKDLYVLTADADAQALIGAVLGRHSELQIRPISFKVERYAGRDSGMVREGPEIARAKVQKSEFSRLLLVWDHHGSGWERKQPTDAEDLLQRRLDGATWKERSGAIVAVPEIEEWLWHCPASVTAFLNADQRDFERVQARIGSKSGIRPEHCAERVPKELFEDLMYLKLRRRPLPGDFERLGASADLTDWCASSAFAKLVQKLQDWFPRR